MHYRVPQVSALNISISLYRLLIRAYPRGFREQYGSHMLQVFRDRCRERLGARGTSGLVLWWAVAAIDFVGSVIQQHLRKESYMTVPGYIRASGAALIAGAIGIEVGLLMILNDANSWNLSVSLFMLGTLLISVGALGVRERFGARLGNLGRNLLLAGILASLLMYTVFFESVWDLGFALPFYGLAILLASLAVVGILGAQAGVLPASLGWNLAAAAYFIILLLWSDITGEPGDWSWSALDVIALVMSLLTTVALARLGLLLMSGPAREQAPA